MGIPSYYHSVHTILKQVLKPTFFTIGTMLVDKLNLNLVKKKKIEYHCRYCKKVARYSMIRIYDKREMFYLCNECASKFYKNSQHLYELKML